MDNLWHWLRESGPVMRSVLWHVWEWIHPALKAAFVAISIAIIGLFVSWKQLQYMQKRDEALDIRDSWTETHKLMITFRFKREQLNLPNMTYPMSANNAIAASEALHDLKAQLDRMPDSELVKQIADFLHANEAAEDWRSQNFVEPFDEYARQAALLARPAATKQISGISTTI
jgi:hypothetical protein